MENTALSRGRESHLSVGFIRATVKIMENVGFEKVRGTECLYRYRPNGKYYARFVVNGKEVRRSLRTSDRDIAKRHVLQIRREAAVIDPQASKITLAGLCNRYLPTVRHQAAKTVAPTSRYCAQYSISLLPIRSCLNPQLLVSKSADEKSQSGSRPVGSSSSGSLQMFVHNRLTLTPKTALISWSSSGSRASGKLKRIH